MKFLRTTLVILICLVAFSACETADRFKSSIYDLKSDTEKKIDNVKNTANEIKTEISEAKESVDETIEDIKNATQEVSEAIEQLNEASEAIGKVISGEEETKNVTNLE